MGPAEEINCHLFDHTSIRKVGDVANVSSSNREPPGFGLDERGGPSPIRIDITY